MQDIRFAVRSLTYSTPYNFTSIVFDFKEDVLWSGVTFTFQFSTPSCNVYFHDPFPSTMPRSVINFPSCSKLTSFTIWWDSPNRWRVRSILDRYKSPSSWWHDLLLHYCQRIFQYWQKSGLDLGKFQFLKIWPILLQWKHLLLSLEKLLGPFQLKFRVVKTTETFHFSCGAFTLLSAYFVDFLSSLAQTCSSYSWMCFDTSLSHLWTQSDDFSSSQ